MGEEALMTAGGEDRERCEKLEGVFFKAERGEGWTGGAG